jgi:hypothetical protein
VLGFALTGFWVEGVVVRGEEVKRLCVEG